MPSAPTAGPFPLSEIAKIVGGDVVGDGTTLICQVNTLEHAGPGEIAFLSNPKYRSQLLTTAAAAIVLSADNAPHASGPRLVVEQPYLAYARIAQLLNPVARP